MQQDQIDKLLDDVEPGGVKEVMFSQTEISAQESRLIQQAEEAAAEMAKPKALTMRYWPDQILSQPCIPVAEINDNIRRLAQDMIFTMMVHHGVGLAAPQVGERLRMFVVDVEWIKGVEHARPYVFINPAIVPYTDIKVESKEGCLSFPNTHAVVKRQASVTILAQDLTGEFFDLECHGLMARVVQHENDHLDGVTINKSLTRIQRNELRKGLKIVSRAR